MLVYVCMYVYIYVYMCMCVCIWAYIYIYIYNYFISFGYITKVELIAHIIVLLSECYRQHSWEVHANKSMLRSYKT